jgi:hypothetical protein
MNFVGSAQQGLEIIIVVAAAARVTRTVFPPQTGIFKVVFNNRAQPLPVKMKPISKFESLQSQSR